MAYRVRWSDQRIDTIMGHLLRTGVMIAAAVVLAGAVMYLLHFGRDTVLRRHPPADLRSLSAIVRGALALDSRAIIQFGLVLLVATPIARVLFAFIGFSLQRDRAYMVISAIVFTFLLLSFTGGFAAG